MRQRVVDRREVPGELAREVESEQVAPDRRQPSSLAATTSRTRHLARRACVGLARLDRVQRVGVLRDGGAAAARRRRDRSRGRAAGPPTRDRRGRACRAPSGGRPRTPSRMESSASAGASRSTCAVEVRRSEPRACRPRAPRRQRRHAVAEAAVDHGLGRPQGGDRLAAAVVDVRELAAHQRGEQPAPAVRGPHADERHARDRHLSARHREAAREDPGSGHDPAAIAQHEDALGLEHALPALVQVLGLTSRWNAE